MSNLATIYQDGTYAAKNPTFGDDNAEWKISNAVKFCEKHSIPATRVAEVGCGGGAILTGVAKGLGAAQAVGYEPMPEAYTYAKERETDCVTFQNTSVSPESKEDFDLVLCFDVFEHIEDYFGFLRNLRQIGKNFLFHIPLDMNAQMVLRGEPIRRVREEVGHIHFFSKDSALAALAECGYEVRAHEYTCGADSCYSSVPYRLMSYPRRIFYALSPDHAVRILGGYSVLVWATA